jgi:hypothetical protein
MKAEDLRIGNYVQDKDGNIGVVKAIDSDRISQYKGKQYIGTASIRFKHYNGNIGQWIDTLFPIIITDDILEKCNFHNHGLKMSGSIWLEYYRPSFYRGNIRITQLKNREWGLTFESVSPPTQIIFKIRYLHELQNLFFLLNVGKDLEVSL